MREQLWIEKKQQMSHIALTLPHDILIIKPRKPIPKKSYREWAQKDLNLFTDKALTNSSLSNWKCLLQVAYSSGAFIFLHDQEEVIDMVLTEIIGMVLTKSAGRTIGFSKPVELGQICDI